MVEWRVMYAAVFLILLLYLHSMEAQLCPIGFEVAYSKIKENQPICYSLKKHPEKFTGKFENCPGNLFTHLLYSSLIMPDKPEVKLWTDYKSLYPGGPFVDWSYTESTGKILQTTYEVHIGPGLGSNEELCVMVDPVTNFTAVRCDELHYRYCFLDIYPNTEWDFEDDGCEQFDNSIKGKRFWSPLPICLAPMIDGVTWSSAQDRCKKIGGSLLSQGWKYSNCPSLWPSSSKTASMMFPLGLKRTAEDKVLQIKGGDISEIPASEWHFNGSTTSKYSVITSDGASLGAVSNGLWFLVHSSYNFSYFICEKPVDLIHANLTLTLDSKGQITLDVELNRDKELETNDIYCFTDSVSYYPLRVSWEGISGTHTYKFKPVQDGYYWCTLTESKNFHIAESNKLLYVQFKTPTITTYAVKVQQKDVYSLDHVSYLARVWEKNIWDYVDYSVNYVKNKPYALNLKLKHALNLKLKRLYNDGQTVLFHVTVHDYRHNWSAVKPGQWNDIEILYIKPSYDCDTSYDSKLALGESRRGPDCKIYTCIGDYNEGVQLVTNLNDTCLKDLATSTTPSPTNVTTPTPEELTQQVITNLETLLNSDQPIFIENVTETLNQVDRLLSNTKDLRGDLLHFLNEFGDRIKLEDINSTTIVNRLLSNTNDTRGYLLQLIDELGGRVKLKGINETAIVLENIAFLVADAAPADPVWGLRIAASVTTGTFTNNAFKILRDIINSTYLTRNKSEVLVQLPDSIASSSRRVSFVVFRNDRAFPAQRGHQVNSAVLSINVENVTQLRSGEMINIHFTPYIYPERNQDRTCAYWHFFENKSGIWSQDGCNFIRANKTGMLDACSCNHLTHFAEILIPRTIFSERTEHVLEIVSVIGLSLSMIGLLLVGVTAALFRSWRQEYRNKVWLQLCVAIALMSLCFLIVVFANFELNGIACMAVGVTLHYAVLASFCWMVVAAVLSYRRLVTVFAQDASHKLLKAAAFAWGVPCVIVGVLLSVAPNSYSDQFKDKSPSGAFCYPSGLAKWLSVFAPIVIMLLVNWTLFALIVRSVFFSQQIQRHGDTNEAFRAATVSCLLAFLFGLPWIFGLFSSHQVAAYIFTFFTTLQGFILFLFFVLGNKPTRDLWLNALKIKLTRNAPVTSSTYTNDNIHVLKNTRFRF